MRSYKPIRNKIEDLINIELNALPIYDDIYIYIYIYIKYKIRTYSDKVYAKVLEDDIRCEFSTIISIDYLHAYENKHYL